MYVYTRYGNFSPEHRVQRRSTHLWPEHQKGHWARCRHSCDGEIDQWQGGGSRMRTREVVEWNGDQQPQVHWLVPIPETHACRAPPREPWSTQYRQPLSAGWPGRPWLSLKLQEFPLPLSFPLLWSSDGRMAWQRTLSLLRSREESCCSRASS